MRFLIKSASIIFIVLLAGIYIDGCSSAEQTTAKLAYQQGDYAKAETEFLKETQQNPANEEAWFYLGLSRVQLNKVDGAKEAFIQYKNIGKNTYSNELISAWGTKYDEGYRSFTAAEGLKDKDIPNAIKNYQKALQDFQMAYAMLPESTVVSKNISVVNDRINTFTIKPILDKGVALEKDGKYDEAITEYKKALDQVTKGDSNYETVIYDISVAYLKQGEQMRTSNPDDPAFKDKYKAALPYLEELTGSKDKNNQLLAYDLLVQVYANLGMNDKAMDAIKKRDELKNNK
jgi:tetratricopeptide (TPR) repeat protein